ncbi:MAG: hypothetical protein A2X37_11655 [Elusimicrobia bacterium GWA2_66_18]|nr:MAG: hypothetical protein A2X37_11655 [Elusimicrobia bacterium GWA2_66_18]
MRLAAAALCALTALPRPACCLEAAAGRVDITPDLRTEKVLLAGFGATGRKPAGVHDPLYARLLVLREGATTVALVGLDLLGMTINDTQDLRRLAGYDRTGRSLFVHATHTHSGPDTLGLWGPVPGVSGVNLRYHRRIKETVSAALKLLESRLRPVRASGARGALDPRGLCRDSRDPQVIDPDLAVLRLMDKAGKTVVTIVNWSCHPEVLGKENHLITADFPGPLCARVEEKTGGACLFLNGMIGGLMTPDTRSENFYESARVGAAVADAALALKPGAAGAGLFFRSQRVLVPVENSRYRLALPALTFGHRLLNAEGRPLPSWKRWSLALRHLLIGLTEQTQPWVESEVSVLRIGPAIILGMPGEVFPELAVGGYDGRYAFGRPVLTSGNPDPPDLSQAPKGPFLRDLVKSPVPMLAGLANDELGYLVPAYDFKARQSKLMLPRMRGHHYEETNSIGPAATGLLSEAAARLLKSSR